MNKDICNIDIISRFVRNSNLHLTVFLRERRGIFAPSRFFEINSSRKGFLFRINLNLNQILEQITHTSLELRANVIESFSVSRFSESIFEI